VELVRGHAVEREHFRDGAADSLEENLRADAAAARQRNPLDELQRAATIGYRREPHEPVGPGVIVDCDAYFHHRVLPARSFIADQALRSAGTAPACVLRMDLRRDRLL
jgi:hypothetical protein